MRPLPRLLDPEVVWASEERSLTSSSSVTGVVIDTTGLPVGGSQVQFLGTGRGMLTADDGSFSFRHARAGTFVLEVRAIGFHPVRRALTITKDDQRYIVLRLSPLAQMLQGVNIEAESGFGPRQWASREFDERQRWRSAISASEFLSPDRLAQLHGAPLQTIFEGSAGFAPCLQMARGNRGCDACVLEDGERPVLRPLSAYSAADVEMVEYFPQTGMHYVPENMRMPRDAAGWTSAGGVASSRAPRRAHVACPTVGGTRRSRSAPGGPVPSRSARAARVGAECGDLVAQLHDPVGIARGADLAVQPRRRELGVGRGAGGDDRMIRRELGGSWRVLSRRRGLGRSRVSCRVSVVERRAG